MRTVTFNQKVHCENNIDSECEFQKEDFVKWTGEEMDGSDPRVDEVRHEHRIGRHVNLIILSSQFHPKQCPRELYTGLI